MLRVLTLLVGVRGLEPPASATRTLRASQLRYTPFCEYYAIRQFLSNLL